VLWCYDYQFNFLGGLGAAGSLNMTVEQVPKNRGTIMSMSAVFVTFGASIGSGIGGVVLALSGTYQAVGWLLERLVS
jgi:predicted MFS family arabinose efflux permease